MHGAIHCIVAIVAISALIGLVRGFVREAISLVTWLIAIWVAWRYCDFAAAPPSAARWPRAQRPGPGAR